jgi:hypothetical protein
VPRKHNLWKAQPCVPFPAKQLQTQCAFNITT